MAVSRFQQFIEKRWYSDPGALHVLRPLETLFTFTAKLKKESALKKQKSVAVPVLVVGNITVGGTGKTPTIICLLKFLLRQGFKPGVISRGYGRKSRGPIQVNEKSTSAEVGDEALLIFRETDCPVVLHSKRIKAARFLLKNYSDCNLIIADDGLQHYALARDLELVLVDGKRLFGNGHALPLGPLREAPERLQTVDWVLVNMRQHAELHAVEKALKGIEWTACELIPAFFQNLGSLQRMEISVYQNHYRQQILNALTAIAYPDDFFASLQKLNLKTNNESYPDHFQWQVSQLKKFSAKALVCTSKDAVKLQQLVASHPELDATHWYSLETEMHLPETLKVEISTRLQKCMQKQREQNRKSI